MVVSSAGVKGFTPSSLSLSTMPTIFLRVYFNDRSTDTVAGFVDGNLATVGRVERLVNVRALPRSSLGSWWFSSMMILSASAQKVGVAPTPLPSRISPLGVTSVASTMATFYLAQKSVTQVLRQVREVHVEVGNLVGVDGCTGIFVRLVGCTASDGFCTGEGAVYVVAGSRHRCRRQSGRGVRLHVRPRPVGRWRQGLLWGYLLQ